MLTEVITFLAKQSLNKTIVKYSIRFFEHLLKLAEVRGDLIEVPRLDEELFAPVRHGLMLL